MKHKGNGPAINTRALECAITGGAALLAADSIRALLDPFWLIMRMLFGL